MTFFVTLVLNGLSFGALLFVLSSGFTVTYGLMRIVNLAHGAFYLIGGYIGLSVEQITGNFWLALVAGSIATALLGLITERLLMRRIRHQPLAEVLLTVGFAIVLADVALHIWGGNPQTIQIPAELNGPIQFSADLYYPKFRIVIIGAAAVIGAVLFILQSKTKIGARVRAGVDDRETVAALGVDIDRIFTGVFVLGALLAGFSGVIGGALLTLSPGADTTILLYALVVVVIGGTGSLTGAAIGAVAVGLIDAFGKAFLPDLAYFTLFAPMLLVLVFRPRGLLGRAL
jgi:branched-chain amino acid transport system permease protein